MAKPVVMPQMGESVAEGTIVRWLKKVGDPVERDEPLFEISTDKVDAEIPSPSAGVLSQINVNEGETVPINTVVGVVDEAAAASAPGATAPKASTPGATAPAASAPSAPPPKASAPGATAANGSAVPPSAVPDKAAPASTPSPDSTAKGPS